MRALLKIIISWIIFPFSFFLWHLDIKYHRMSEGLAKDYIFWYKHECNDMKKYSQSHRGKNNG